MGLKMTKMCNEICVKLGCTNDPKASIKKHFRAQSFTYFI